jgi:hypothetical protein
MVMGSPEARIFCGKAHFATGLALRRRLRMWRNGFRVNNVLGPMSMRYRLLLALVLLAGCAHSGSWHNPNLPPAQAKSDEATCRRFAEEDMGQQAYSSPGTENSDSPMQMVDRSEQRKHFKTLVADCMERKGYRRGD